MLHFQLTIQFLNRFHLPWAVYFLITSVQFTHIAGAITGTRFHVGFLQRLVQYWPHNTRLRIHAWVQLHDHKTSLLKLVLAKSCLLPSVASSNLSRLTAFSKRTSCRVSKSLLRLSALRRQPDHFEHAASILTVAFTFDLNDYYAIKSAPVVEIAVFTHGSPTFCGPYWFAVFIAVAPVLVLARPEALA